MAQKRKKGGGRISKVKRNNQVRNKLVKQGKIKVGIHKRKSLNKPQFHHTPQIHPVEEEEGGSDDGVGLLEMVEKDDLEFMKSAVANRRYSILNKIRITEKPKRKPAKVTKNVKTIEDEFEDSKMTEVEPGISMKPLLPIKTKHGLVRREMKQEVKEEPPSDNEESALGDENDKANDAAADSDDDMDVDLDDAEEDLSSLTTVELFARREEALQKRKFLIGVLCSGILENPQEKIKNFKFLMEMMDEKNPEVQVTVKKLACVSILEVFKDILPSYQIKNFVPDKTMMKKETLMLQGYENSLLNYYKTYLQKLEKIINVITKRKGQKNQKIDLKRRDVRLAEIAFKCLCELMVSHSYFNFWKNIVQLVVPFLNHKLPSVRSIAADTVKNVFRNDKRGEITCEIVRKTNSLVKAKAHSVHMEVLEVLLFLRLKDVNLDKEKEDEMKRKKFMNHKQKLQFLSKKERKKSKQLDELEKELLETKAEENKQSKKKYLTETTKAIFTIYFRILKTAPHSKVLSLTLEGLAKYAHCINIEFYHDLVNVLDGLISGNNDNNVTLGHREQLHCVQTVFSILSGPGIAISIDPLRFYSHLYRNLLNVTAGKNYDDLPIVISSVDTVLVKRRKKASLQCQMAFTKRLSTLSLLVLQNGSLSILKIIKTILQLSKSVDVLLDPESTIGGGTYLPELEEPEYCNASNSALWELLFLIRHYHPTVRKFAHHILHGSPVSGEGNLLPELAKMSPEQLFKEFDSKEMTFKPPVPPPKHQSNQSRTPKKVIFKNLYFQRKAESALNDFNKDVQCSDTDFYCDFMASKNNKRQRH